MKDVKKLIRDYLEEAKLMQLATSADNQPWTCSVWFGFDEDLNIYWFSSTTRRHSREVVKNPKVSAAIVLPHTPKDKPRGLQLQGIAEQITSKKEIVKATLLFAGRIFTRRQITDFMKMRDNPHAFYKIKPTLFVLFDAVNFPENSRQEYRL
ncbi:pyridoxamine 5'-phosphate oxidase family protein [Patescibacteria group bacterium]|nr:pyridoxamine 5'-phosphate oxidase family protein [Patescibacteria group bacterium]